MVGKKATKGKSWLVIDPLGHCQGAESQFPGAGIEGRVSLAALLGVSLFDGRLNAPGAEAPEDVKHVTFFVMGANHSKARGNFWTSLDAFPEPDPIDLYGTSFIGKFLLAPFEPLVGKLPLLLILVILLKSLYCPLYSNMCSLDSGFGYNRNNTYRKLMARLHCFPALLGLCIATELSRGCRQLKGFIIYLSSTTHGIPSQLSEEIT